MKIFKPIIPSRYRPRGLEIIHEDRDILVVVKESGLLTMSYRRDETRTAEKILTSYLRKGDPKSRLRAHVVHRLDRDTSGLLLFAKTEDVQQRLKNDWPRTEKFYLAVVHGHPEPAEGVISSYLAEDDDQFVHTLKGEGQGRLSHTAYGTIKVVKGFGFLKINLLTGRKNQIRVHLKEKGCPVVGDLKYGRKDTSKARLMLHAKTLAFHHPHRGERVLFNTPVPEVFSKLAGGLDETEWLRTSCPSSIPR